MLIKQVKTREAIWNQKIVTYYKTCVLANDKPVSLQDSLWYRIVYDTRSNILSSLYTRMREGIMPREQPHFSLLSYTHIYTLPVCAYHTYSHLYTYTYIYCSTHTHTHFFLPFIRIWSLWCLSDNTWSCQVLCLFTSETTHWSGIEWQYQDVNNISR